MRSPAVELFVLGHVDETLSKVPRVRGLRPVNLRSVSVEFAHDDRFADTRFLLSPEARATDADFIGLFSAHYDQKWPAPPHLADLPSLARQLQSSQALGEELSGLDD